MLKPKPVPSLPFLVVKNGSKNGKNEKSEKAIYCILQSGAVFRAIQPSANTDSSSVSDQNQH